MIASRRQILGTAGLATAGLLLPRSPVWAAPDPTAELASIGNHVMSTGPNGEQPSPASSVSLSSDEIAKIRAMKATAAIVMHYSGNDWSRAQIAGLKEGFSKLGIDVIAVTDAGFKADRQVSDIETVLAQHPNIIVSIPTDPVATADAYAKAAAQGTKLVFMDNVPHGMTAGHGYVSVVSADNYGNGVTAGLLMAQALKSQGNVGLVYFAADFFVTKQRYTAVKATLAKFPGIKIVAEQGIGGPDFSGDAEQAATAMLTAHPDLNGIWAVWDVPAEGVIAAARTAGNNDLVITTCDLGVNVAIEMASKGFVKGLGAQRPFDQGLTETLLAGYGLLGKTAPAYVALPALPVTRSNLLTAWTEVYHTPAPKDVVQSM
ncbi:substrate-binding domain-containing protein [Acidisoma cellulosilytica]|uniref:Substrate-binding domain-containing protein n=1 Tax=Acidisoma cellulosilyticum TaxID=2802395 RepID=A0A964E4J1_9PROT|nr:substrate-binding domain-containing protein [Acidisoma cellulosilyticum]MCB8881327.1 substrate-binding domain-containing protein [Acidisoma cellulosilyticum]